MKAAFCIQNPTDFQLSPGHSRKSLEQIERELSAAKRTN